MSTADRVRGRVGAAIFERVAGPNGPERRALIRAPGERWFAENRPIRRVHGDSAMFVGGLRALLLQSLHPLAMAAVAGHAGYRGGPWGRPTTAPAGSARCTRPPSGAISPRVPRRGTQA